jgi:inorganic pyrophosphatase
MHTKQPQNLITEHQSGSKKLQAFGVPVPFNYGCFPQTIRDPTKIDEISGLCGDNDPTDVIDLTKAFVDPGAVVNCRPLGAVCLIDEGKADWKIIVVNVDVESALSDAHSIADVERIAPGRIDEALKWLDDFKRHSTADSRLRFEVHDAHCAVNIIKGDHASYCSLLGEVGATGYARGHWIGSSPQRNQWIGTAIPHRHLASSPVVMNTTYTNATLIEKVPERMPSIRQISHRSAGEDSDASSPASNSSDKELA